MDFRNASISFALEFGFTLAIVLFVGVWLGRRADAAWGTDPWLTLVGIGFGLFLGGAWTYRKLKAISRNAGA